MADLHLRAVPLPDETPAKPAPVFFVIQRANGSWSPAAKIVIVCETEEEAEALALQQKEMHPQQMFGVFMLRSEARQVPKPIAIVRTEET